MESVTNSINTLNVETDDSEDDEFCPFNIAKRKVQECSEMIASLDEKYEEIDRKQTNMARKMLKMIEGFYTPFMPRSDGISDVRIDEVDKKSGTSSHCDMNIFKRSNLTLRNNISKNDAKSVHSHSNNNATDVDGFETIEIIDEDPQNKDDANLLDVIPVTFQVMNGPKDLPGFGNLKRKSIKVGELMYGMRTDSKSSWKLSRIHRLYPEDANTFDVIIDDPNGPSEVKTLRSKQLAYSLPSPVRLTIASRVIATYKLPNTTVLVFHSGFVGELPKTMNDFRYLIFFDDGSASYMTHDGIRLIYSDTEWQDELPREYRRFVRRYISQYPDRPMVRLLKDDTIKVKYNGQFCFAKVIDVDGSLVKMRFVNDGHEETIYRGSTRLDPLLQEFASVERCRRDGHRFRRFNNIKTESDLKPFVEYTTIDLDTEPEDEEDDDVIFVPRRRNVAKKSTARCHNNQLNINCEPTPKMNPIPLPHGVVSTKQVIEVRKLYNAAEAQTMAPLSIPMHFGFKRIAERKQMVYKSPDRKILRTMKQIHQHLRMTKSLMTVDMFDTNPEVKCLNEFIVGNTYVFLPDISNGKEQQPVTCVNCVDTTHPVAMDYITKRVPCAGVPLNLEEEFLCSCDCTDDCQDKRRCSCRKLTIEGQQATGEPFDDNAGYVYRRLHSRVSTGIYECNSRCKCSKISCLNRVVQFPMSQRLQLFKTPQKGWGVRCLNDIPKGAFVCIYVGNLLNGDDADEQGKQYTDDYFAELDFIEIVQNLKEGYESDVIESSDSHTASSSEEEEEDHTDSDISFQQLALADLEKFGSSNIRKTLRKRTTPKDYTDRIRKSSKSSSDNSNRYKLRGRQIETATANNTKKNNSDKITSQISTRSYFGEHEVAYVMDSRICGNIGRFLNHSCEPNLFVQNVFVDTHDLRFPWIAYFAHKYIPAGTELTWDYNYPIGSVENVVKYCFCGSSRCRGRLL